MDDFNYLIAIIGLATLQSSDSQNKVASYLLTVCASCIITGTVVMAIITVEWEMLYTCTDHVHPHNVQYTYSVQYVSAGPCHR